MVSGYDPGSDRCVLHLMDVFGARFSEALGYGTRDGNAIRFVFEYPDSPFHTTFRWSPEALGPWLMEQKNKEGRFTSEQMTNGKIAREIGQGGRNRTLSVPVRDCPVREGERRS